MNRQWITETEAFVRERLGEESTGHDWYHVDRVRRTALMIGAAEGADLPVVELAALLHDIADWKFHGGDHDAGPRVAADWLASLGVPAETIDAIGTIIGEVSFKGAGVATRPTTLEGKVVQDADRLDALGAIGIARTFAYGGHKGQPLHDPLLAPVKHDSFEAYKTNKGTSINHFHEKLLLLKDRMNTDAARRLAASRHQFMEHFLAQFQREWDGDDYRPVCG